MRRFVLALALAAALVLLLAVTVGADGTVACCV